MGNIFLFSAHIRVSSIVALGAFCCCCCCYLFSSTGDLFYLTLGAKLYSAQSGDFGPKMIIPNNQYTIYLFVLKTKHSFLKLTDGRIAGKIQISLCAITCISIVWLDLTKASHISHIRFILEFRN